MHQIKTATSLVLLILCVHLCHAQLPMSSDLRTALADKNSFDEIMQTVTAYYAQRDYMNNPEMSREFKKWNRWAWYASRHLDQNGRFVSTEKQHAAIASAMKEKDDLNDQLQTRTNSGGWTSVGPYDVANGIGRVDRLAFHPSNANHMYAGTPGSGLWQTVNGGAWWTPLNGYMPGLGVSGIIVDVDNPSTLYVLTGDGDSFINSGFIYQRSSIGLMKSTDGGNTWAIHSNVVAPGTTFFGYKLIQSSVFHWVFLAATSNGLYRSTDFGLTWQQNTTIGSTNVFDIEQTINGYMYASTANQVYVSSDWGAAFTAVPSSDFSTPPTSTSRTTLAVTPAAPGVLYVHFGGDGLLYRSDNYGSDFNLVNSNAPQSPAYMTSLAVNLSDPNILICGNINVNISFVGGTSFFPFGGSGVHADVHDLAYNPLNNVLYSGTDGGVYQSVDNGLSWTPIYNGMNATQYYHMGCALNNNGLMLAGSQDNGMHFQNGANPFVYVNGGDGFDAKFKHHDNNTAFYSINAGVFRYTVSTNTSATVLTPAPGMNINDQNFFFPHLAIHPTRDDTIYAGYISRIYRSFNNGANWDTVFQSASAGFNEAGGLAVSASQPDRIYAANRTTVIRSNNLGANWTTISGTPGWPGGSLLITDIQTRNNNADEVWITFGGYGTPKVIYSSNAGANWSNLTGTLPDIPVYCIEYTDDGDAYIGTDAGVYFKDFFMSDWTRFSNGLPAMPVTEVIVDEVNSIIKAATFARGIWQSDLYSNCGPFLLLGGTNEGQNFYQSGGFIETTQVMPGSYGNQLRLRSPQKITFEDGFRAYQNSYLHAVIGNCGQGVFNLTEEPSTILSKDAALKTQSAQEVIK